MHGDFQAMWIDPDNPDHMINGNDGGINITYDGGKTWRDIKNLPIVQFYFITEDMAKPFQIYGTAQDHGCFRGPVTHNPQIGNPYEWERIPGGEASYLALDPTDSNILYHISFFGNIYKSHLKDGVTKHIMPKVTKGEPKLRGNWLAPFILSPHNPFTIYHGTQYVHRSMDRGQTWKRISPDLTTNNPKKQGDVPFCTITTLSESPLKFGLIYVGTDDGNVQVTKNSGVSWKKIMNGLPANKWVSRIIASKFHEATVYVSLSGYRDDDFTAYIYKSTDYGQTWIDIKNNLPCGPINVVKEDPKNKDILYVGTDIGTYISADGGKNWSTLINNMPVTYVHDLTIHPRDNILVAGTHGRSIYALDVSSIQKFDSSIQAKDIHIFEMKTISIPKDWWKPRDTVAITYVLKSPQQEVKITVLDAKGSIIKHLKGTGDEGFNQAFWDLSTDIKKREEYYAKEGVYTVMIQAGSLSTEQKVKLIH
jgi:photosystem II stability/assembly factor-like uncharacterized protein